MIWNGRDKDLEDDLDEAEEEKVLIPTGTPKPTMSSSTNCVLGPGTIFTGNIVSKDDVILSGNLQGNLTTKGNVMLSGTIKGDLNVTATTIDGGTVEGSVTAADTILLKRGSKIKGNIKAKSVSIDAGAAIAGDVTAITVSMEAGAALQGKLNIGTGMEAPASSQAPGSKIKVT